MSNTKTAPVTGATARAAKRTSIAITALGGQGGGVLAQWIVALAEANGLRAQSTSVPGVAQRTGATIYYLELASAAAPEPVLALMPAAGDVDICIASELVEAGRAIERGLVTPGVTTLLASDSRVYAIAEKQALGDGRADADAVRVAARAHAKRCVLFDMQALAEESGGVISAVLFGALAGSGALPFARRAYEEVVRASGRAVEVNLRGLQLGYDGAQKALREVAGAQQPVREVAPPAARAAHEATSPSPAHEQNATPVADGAVSPSAVREQSASLAADGGASPSPAVLRELAGFPETARDVVARGVLRLRDYQDADYAALYLQRLRALLEAGADAALTAEAARRLALWMSFEDVIRVADLKTRAARFAEIAREVRAAPEQFWYAAEFTHPRFEEFCGTLPAGLGGALARSPRAHKILAPFFEKGRVLQTGKLGGFLLLWLLARLRRFRRGTLRYRSEQTQIESWLAALHAALATDAALALEVARCPRILKGYGDTHARGLSRFSKVMERARAGAPADEVRLLREAALADEEGSAFHAALARRAP